MYHCYNEAHSYLYNKYSGPKRLVSSIAKKLSHTPNKKVRQEILDNVQDDDYEYIINDNNVYNTNNPLDVLILTLLKQYNYGISVRKELYNILINNKIKQHHE